MMIIFVKIFNTFFNDKWDNNHGDNRNNNVSVFIGIGNNISICYKFQNDFNDYFQDKNNKNKDSKIRDYFHIFNSIDN